MGVPIIVGDQVRGLVSVQATGEYAYVNLTAASLDPGCQHGCGGLKMPACSQETQRLLDETQQRNSE